MDAPAQGSFGQSLFCPNILPKNTFLGSIYGEILSTELLVQRRHPIQHFVLAYQFGHLKLDLTKSSNAFCHLSHSSNPTARLELWHSHYQPIYRVFTHSQLHKDHHITVGFAKHRLPIPTPCQCGASICRYNTEITTPPLTQSTILNFIPTTNSSTRTTCAPCSALTTRRKRPSRPYALIRPFLQAILEDIEDPDLTSSQLSHSRVSSPKQSHSR